MGLTTSSLSRARTCLARNGITAPPGRHRRKQQRLIEQPLAEPREVGQQTPVLHDAAADAVHDRDRAATRGLQQSGHAELGVGAQLERIGVRRVDPAQDDVDRLEPAQGPGPDPTVVHGQVAADDERIAEQRGQERLVERRLALRARRQQDDVGGLAPGRRDLLQAESHGVEERREPLGPGVAVEPGQQPRDDPPVLHGVAGARTAPGSGRRSPATRRCRCAPDRRRPGTAAAGLASGSGRPPGRNRRGRRRPRAATAPRPAAAAARRGR